MSKTVWIAKCSAKSVALFWKQRLSETSATTCQHPETFRPISPRMTTQNKAMKSCFNSKMHKSMNLLSHPRTWMNKRRRPYQAQGLVNSLKKLRVFSAQAVLLKLHKSQPKQLKAENQFWKHRFRLRKFRLKNLSVSEDKDPRLSHKNITSNRKTASLISLQTTTQPRKS